jgi:transmembrane sensor
MKKEIKHPKQDNFLKEMAQWIGNPQIHWSKSKEDIWMELEKRMETETDAKTIRIYRPWFNIAIAAGFTLLVAISALVKFYNRTIDVPLGMHAEIYLPDKSLVKLNAQSTLSYKPLSWRFSRTVKFEGEAYFEVEKGKKFEVISGNGKTVVMGTAFNIYSRNNEYQVTCITGKVKVIEDAGKKEVIITPGQQTYLKPDGILAVESGIDTDQTLSWLNNRLSFTSVPLRKVFEEIGRQYSIRIIIPPDLENTYTGTFMKDSSVENVLNLVCRPFSLSFSLKSENEYIISRNK